MELVDVFILCGITVLAVFAVAVIGFLAGAWVHHKGVSAGSGVNPNFIGGPKGEVFSINDESGDDFPDDEDNPAERHVLGRASRFMQGFGGSVADGKD